MRLGHFDRLRPICPACRHVGDVLLTLHTEACEAEDVTSGVLRCENCGQAYPIIAGVPILMPDLAGWLAANLHLVLQADISGAAAEAVVGALAGPDSAFNLVRQQQSTYGHSHYGDLEAAGETEAVAGGVVSLLDAGLAGTEIGPGPVLDMGCAVGGATFALAERAAGPVLGIDVNWPLLKIASHASRSGEVRYPLRISGLDYERRSGRLTGRAREKADFWIADALALPFAAGTFAQTVSLNVLDCVPDPASMIGELARTLATEGRFLLCTPLDWASHATPPHLWIADAEAVIKILEKSGLLTDQQTQAEWRLRLHHRSSMTYKVTFFSGVLRRTFV